MALFLRFLSFNLFREGSKSENLTSGYEKKFCVVKRYLSDMSNSRSRPTDTCLEEFLHPLY